MSKLHITKVSAKNFRSIGNNVIETIYDEAPTNLITSDDNGAGKSTVVVWALVYAFFNKAYNPKTTLPRLINTLNNKALEVTVEFETKGSKWKIIRGQKPGKLEVWKDNTQVESIAPAPDFNAYIQNVVGVDLKTFCNTIVLGKEQFKPFIEMSAPERRHLVEQVLDLVIFSDMNEIVKDDLRESKRSAQDIDYRIGLVVNDIENKRATRRILDTKAEAARTELTEEIKKLQDEIDRAEGLMKTASQKISALMNTIEDGEVAKQKQNEYSDLRRKAVNKIHEINGQIQRIHDITTCTTCLQQVGDEHKDRIKESLSENIEKANTVIKAMEDKWNEQAPTVTDGEVAQQKHSQIIGTIQQMRAVNEEKTNRVNALLAKQADSNDYDREIRKISDEIDQKQVEKDGYSTLLEEEYGRQKVMEQSLIILKDDGMKAEIIKKYIPYLNQRINFYLDGMNFWLGLVVDEQFDITITDPSRAKLSVADLSTGQKARVNLAFLLAFRDISKLKASVDCNLLVLDEILENLSETGVGDFMHMARLHLSDTNLWVITQRSSEFSDYFERVVNYRLHDQFTIQT